MTDIEEVKNKKEKRIQDFDGKQLIINELLEMPTMVLETAFLYAINYTQYGEDVTVRWMTSTQNAKALEKAYNKGYSDALYNYEQRQEPCEDWYDIPSDEMTLEQARQAVKDLRKKLAEHLEKESCEDAISRQIISDYVGSHIQEINTGYGDLNKHTNEILRMIVDYIEDMPPVTSHQKIGRWVYDERIDKHYYCSECKSMGVDYWDYCPYCGAKMQEVEE